jgi:hypothetical protein
VHPLTSWSAVRGRPPELDGEAVGGADRQGPPGVDAARVVRGADEGCRVLDADRARGMKMYELFMLLVLKLFIAVYPYLPRPFRLSHYVI